MPLARRSKPNRERLIKHVVADADDDSDEEHSGQPCPWPMSRVKISTIR